MNITYLLLAATLIVLTSFAGKLITLVKGENFLSKNMALFGSFSAGVFVIIVISNLKEGAEHLGLPLAIVVALCGFLLISFIEKILPEAHHHHSDESHHSHDKKSAWKIQIADSMHNIVDGIALATTFAVSLGLGIKMSISVLAHEFVQETGEYFALRATGLNSKKALWQNFLVALTIYIGIIIGIRTSKFEWLEPWILAVTAGAYVSVIVKDLLPHKQTHENCEHTVAIGFFNTTGRFILSFAIGVLVMVGIQQLFPHSHESHTETEVTSSNETPDLHLH